MSLWPASGTQLGRYRSPQASRHCAFSAASRVDSRPWMAREHLAPAGVSGRFQPRQVTGNPSSCGQGQKETWHLPERSFQGRGLRGQTVASPPADNASEDRHLPIAGWW